MRIVIAILAAHLGERVSADRLIDEVWGDTPPKTASAALQVYVSKLRRLFEPELTAGAESAFLRSDAGGYILEVPVEQVDIARFGATCRDADADEGQLATALDMWHGEPFAEFADESWAIPRVVELRQLRCGAVHRRCRVAIAAGRDATVVDLLRATIKEFPYEERLVGLLMTALYRLGDQRGALDVYAATRELLVEELGLDPTPELSQLELLILQHDASLLEGMRLRPAAISDRALTRPAMYGRADDLNRVSEALETGRLVTIHGPGGVGKTRLAQEMADQHHDCPVIDLSSAQTVPEASASIAQALQVEGDPLTATATSIGLAIAASHGFVVLDNCELLVPDLGGLIADILRPSDTVRILATSRRTIGLAAERVVRLDTLVPAGDPTLATTDIAEFAELPSVRLLCARSGIEITEGNIADVAELIRRLDGLPLALELASVRLRSRGAVDLAVDLAFADAEDTSPPDVPARHRSLNALLRNSIDELNDRQRRVLESLAVFASAVPLEAVVRLMADEMAAVEVRITVAELADRSLVATTQTEHGVRYRLLETVRTYCRSLRSEHEEEDRNALVKLLSKTATESLLQGDPQFTLSDVDADVSAVLADFERQRTDAAAHLSLLTPVASYWYGVGRVREARQRLRTAIELYPDADQASIGLSSGLLGMISFGDGAFHDLARFTGEALATLEPLGLPGLGFVRAGHHVGRGEPEQARVSITEFLAEPFAVGRQRLAGLEVAAMSAWFCGDLVGSAEAFRDQAEFARSEGDAAFESHAKRSEAMLVALAGEPERALDLARRANELDPGHGRDRAHIERLAASAVIRHEFGDMGTAVADATASLELCVRRFNASAVTLAVPIASAGALAGADTRRVARLTGWYEALCRSTGLYGPPTSRRLLDDVTSQAEASVDHSTWVRDRADGASVGLGGVLARDEPSGG